MLKMVRPKADLNQKLRFSRENQTKTDGLLGEPNGYNTTDD